jgi:hypothetical protein
MSTSALLAGTNFQSFYRMMPKTQNVPSVDVKTPKKWCLHFPRHLFQQILQARPAIHVTEVRVAHVKDRPL